MENFNIYEIVLKVDIFIKNYLVKHMQIMSHQYVKYDVGLIACRVQALIVSKKFVKTRKRVFLSIFSIFRLSILHWFAVCSIKHEHCTR